mgnify:CR=1 FL=1
MLVEIKKNETIAVYKPICKRTDIFQIVKNIPNGYVIWNIGENMGTDEYIPICQIDNKYAVDLTSLKAVKVTQNECELLRKAAAYGVNSLQAAEKAIKNKRNGYLSKRKRLMASKTIDVFRRISE